MERVTVLIPTRSRYGTLRFAVQSALNQSYPNLEVIVSDNCSADETSRIAYEYQDSRLSYYRTPKPLSMAANFEFALSKASPGWLVVLGDDDGLIPDRLVPLIATLTRSGCLALASKTGFFKWPDVRDNTGSAMSVPLSSGTAVKHGHSTLRAVMSGGSSYNELPLLYTGGIVHSELVDTLRTLNGRVFNADAPDVYSAIALGRICGSYLSSSNPFAISGISRSSNGGTRWDVTTFTPQGSAEEFLRESRLPINPQIPTVRNGQMPPFVPAMVYDSYLQSSGLSPALPGINASQQARMFASQLYGGHPFIQQWIGRFCELNSIKREPFGLRKFLSRIGTDGTRLAGITRNALSRYRLDNHECIAIKTVYDASVVAAYLLDTRSWAASTYLRTAQNVVRRRLRHIARRGLPERDVS